MSIFFLAYYNPTLLIFHSDPWKAMLVPTFGHLCLLVPLFEMFSLENFISLLPPHYLGLSVNITFLERSSLNILSKVMPLSFYHNTTFYFLRDLYHNLKLSYCFMYVFWCSYCGSSQRVRIILFFSPFFPSFSTLKVCNKYVLSEWMCVQMSGCKSCPKLIAQGLMWRRKSDDHWRGWEQKRRHSGKSCAFGLVSTSSKFSHMDIIIQATLSVLFCFWNLSFLLTLWQILFCFLILASLLTCTS